ncbi:MAG: hypothetical protein H7842_08980, partial [Gammaproteobacteria bacterium SHHR-1]
MSLTSIDTSQLQQLQSRHAGTSQAAQTYQNDLDFAEKLLQQSNGDPNQAIDSLVKPSPGYFAELTGTDYSTAVDLV